jgi:hypothetical protein
MSRTYQILMISDSVEFLLPIFYAVFWQPFWKWQTPWKFWKCRIAPIMVISTSLHFQNGHHNTAQIQHCPISTTFHMWVDYDVPNRFLTLIMMSRIYSWHSKISSGRHFQNGHHCGIVMAILKMVTARNFSMSGINSGHHNLPTYEMSLKSDNVEFVWYCGSH